METNSTELLPVKEAAVLVRQHPNTVRRAIREGRLAAVRLGPGGQLRIPRRALEDFVQPVTGDDPQERED